MVVDSDTGSVEPGEKKERSAVIKLAIAGVLVVLFIVFIVQNADSADVNFLAWSFGVRQFVLMLASAIIGIAIWELASLMWRRRRRSSV
ncbi:MAG: LapA family protein [Actinomycetia bacterium]|nr:LapA family protein [Actinomycetes bacterium]